MAANVPPPWRPCPLCELLAAEAERSRQLGEVMGQVAALAATVERLAAILERQPHRPVQSSDARRARASDPARLGIADLEARLAVSRNTIAAWCKAGRLPKPHYLGEMRRWFVHEIEAWEAEHTAPGRKRRRQERG